MLIREAGVCAPRAAAPEVELADADAIRSMNALTQRSDAREHSEKAKPWRAPRKLLSEAVAKRAARKGDSAAVLAQRVEDMCV